MSSNKITNPTTFNILNHLQSTQQIQGQDEEVKKTQQDMPSNKTAIVLDKQSEHTKNDLVGDWKSITSTLDGKDTDVEHDEGSLKRCLASHYCFWGTAIGHMALHMMALALYQEWVEDKESALYYAGFFALVLTSLMIGDLALYSLNRLNTAPWRKKMCIAIGIDLFCSIIAPASEMINECNYSPPLDN